MWHQQQPTDEAVEDLANHVQHRECELQVDNIEQIKQPLVEVWQSSNTASE